MCNPVALGVAAVAQGAITAVGQAQQSRAANKAAKKQYEYKLKIRENRWMREKLGYKTKLVQYKTNLDESNIAAQRAYTQAQINLNNVRSQAMLDHAEDFKSMLKAEGMMEAQAAQRGVRGRSVERALTENIAKLGLANRARTRALTQTIDRFNEANQSVQRQLRSRQNELYGQVAISPVPDIPPPQPVMKNVSSQLFLGLASAGISGLTTYYSSKAPSVDDGGKSDGGGSGGDSGGGSKKTSFGYDYTDYSPNINWYQ